MDFNLEDDDMSDDYFMDNSDNEEKDYDDFHSIFPTDAPDITREDEEKDVRSYYDQQRVGASSCVERDLSTYIEGGGKYSKLQEKITISSESNINKTDKKIKDFCTKNNIPDSIKNQVLIGFSKLKHSTFLNPGLLVVGYMKNVKYDNKLLDKIIEKNNFKLAHIIRYMYLWKL